MHTKAHKSIHDAETCEVVRNLRKLLRDANRGAEVNALVNESLARQLRALTHAADTYMAAVVCYNENPWGRANVRKYDAATTRLHELLHVRPNAIYPPK